MARASMTGSSEDKEVSPPSTSDRLTQQPPARSITFPEGGLQAWLTVAGGFLVVVCTSGTMQSFGVYQDYYTRVSLTEYPTSDIAWIGQVFARDDLKCLTAQIATLQIRADFFLLFRWSIECSSMMDGSDSCWPSGACSMSFLLSLVQPHQFYQILLSQGFGMGIAMGILFLPTLSIQAHYFKRRRALAMGIIMSGSSVGSVAYPIMINHFFNGPIGFAWGVRIVTFVYLVLLFIANAIMRTRLPPAKLNQDNVPVNIRNILTDGPFWVCIAGIAATFWGLFVPSKFVIMYSMRSESCIVFYIQLFAAENHVSSIVENYVVAIFNAAGFFGRIVPMIFADMWSASNGKDHDFRTFLLLLNEFTTLVIIPITVVAGGLVFAMLGATSDGGVVAFAILFGFFSGGFVSLTAPASAAFSRNIGEVGTRLGFMTFLASFALLTGEPISGVLLSPPAYSWTRPIIFSQYPGWRGIARLGENPTDDAQTNQLNGC
ncbi:MFS general substrate transporter [Lanmaoa asiatica]|nr:MFS general substrate transporter [Lanmaoa asiatica]